MKKNNDSFKYRNRLNDVEPWQSINAQFKGFFLKFEEPLQNLFFNYPL